MQKQFKIVCALALPVVLGSCKAVKAYQRQMLGDYYMQQAPLPSEKLESEAMTYREGASGGDSGKTGGGCGCN